MRYNGSVLAAFWFISGRVIDWSIDFLKTASGASQVYEVDYTSALLEEGGKQFDKVRHSTVSGCKCNRLVNRFFEDSFWCQSGL